MHAVTKNNSQNSSPYLININTRPQLIISDSKYFVSTSKYIKGPFYDSQHSVYDSRLIARLTPDVDKNLPRPRRWRASPTSSVIMVHQGFAFSPAARISHSPLSSFSSIDLTFQRFRASECSDHPYVAGRRSAR